MVRCATLTCYGVANVAIVSSALVKLRSVVSAWHDRPVPSRVSDLHLNPKHTPLHPGYPAETAYGASPSERQVLLFC